MRFLYKLSITEQNGPTTRCSASCRSIMPLSISLSISLSLSLSLTHTHVHTHTYTHTHTHTQTHTIKHTHTLGLVQCPNNVLRELQVDYQTFLRLTCCVFCTKCEQRPKPLKSCKPELVPYTQTCLPFSGLGFPRPSSSTPPLSLSLTHTLSLSLTHTQTHTPSLFLSRTLSHRRGDGKHDSRRNPGTLPRSKTYVYLA